MFQSLFVFHIGIIFLFKVTHTRGQLSVFATTKPFDWFNAKRRCTLIKDEKSIAYSNIPNTLGWTNFSAKYLPWVEYLGCFQIWSTVNNFQEKQVTKGEQLQECLIHCNTSKLFGLQNSTCICLDSNLTELSRSLCDKNVSTCSGDPFAFCGTRGGTGYLSLYQKVTIDTEYDNMGNCLEFDNKHGIRTRNRKIKAFKANNCSTKSIPMCFSIEESILKIDNTAVSNWKDAFNNCRAHNLASYSNVIDNINQIKKTGQLWLSNTRRWTRVMDVTGNPYFCVAARIKQNGVVERFIRKCRDRLPALCLDVTKTSIHAPSKTSHTLSLGTTSSSRINNTFSTLQSITFKVLTSSTYSASKRRTLSFQFESTTAALKKTTSKSKVVDRRRTSSSQIVSTTPGMKIPTGRSKVVQETITSTPDWKETTFSVVEDSISKDLPGEDGVSAILIIAIVAATILIVIVILVTIVLCRRKKNTPVPISNVSLAMVGKEVMYAQVNKPTVKREQSTSSQEPQPDASDDTYDNMDHRRLNRTHNPTESNYDTMRSIANAGEEENNYDHVTGTKMDHQRFVVDGASHYSHVEVECHEVKDK